MKKACQRLAALFLLVCLFMGLIPFVLADGQPGGYPVYVVESFKPNGYCYLYSKPSTMDDVSVNLGPHYNGEQVSVIAADTFHQFYYVLCSNGKTGYIKFDSLTPYEETLNRPIYPIYSSSPAGYCYMYDQPSSINGKNLGKYRNGSMVEIVDWNADTNYAKVKGLNTGKYGYINKKSICTTGTPYQFTAVVNSIKPMGYCYLYSKPSSIDGVNKGPHYNGETVKVIDWYSDPNFAQVECANGEIGYMRKTSLSR